MSDRTQRDEMRSARLVYEIPGMEEVLVRRDVEYFADEDGALTMDLYLPPESRKASESEPAERRPVVVLVSGFPDAGFERVVGCRFMEMGYYVSLGQALAASGLAAIAYTNRDPVVDLGRLLVHLREQAGSLGLDETRVGLFACSGNVPTALSALMEDADGSFACAALSYGYTLDEGGATHVADTAARFGFVNPSAGRSVDDLPADLPLFLVRAGQDVMPGLNETLDRFLSGALAHNLPVTLVNLASAPHAFDLYDDSEASRETIRQVLAFLRRHLLGASA